MDEQSGLAYLLEWGRDEAHKSFKKERSRKLRRNAEEKASWKKVCYPPSSHLQSNGHKIDHTATTQSRNVGIG